MKRYAPYGRHPSGARIIPWQLAPGPLDRKRGDPPWPHHWVLLSDEPGLRGYRAGCRCQGCIDGGRAFAREQYARKRAEREGA